MNSCPPEIHQALLTILENRILHIRGAASDGDAERCFVEADHIHNIPELLRFFRLDLLKFYWTVERPCFVAQVPSADVRGLEKAWRVIEDFLQETAPSG
jgi:hypothetical protein